jgi:hypothetical protein
LLSCDRQVTEIKDKTAAETSKILDQVWFCCYPCPLCCIIDNGNEFLGTEFQELLRLYGIQPILQLRIHKQMCSPTLGNMIRTYELENFEFDYNDPCSQRLANCAWSIRSTAHRIFNDTTTQIVFRRDMLFDLSFTTNYSDVNHEKQKTSDLNVDRENTKEFNMTIKLMI